MADVIPEKYLDLFQKKAFAHLATLNADGTPQVTPVWVDYDGTHILVNSARGRRKDKNMERNRSVALSIQDPDNPYRYMEVRGRVEEIPRKAPISTSTRWRRNTWVSIRIPTVNQAKCGCCIRSNPSTRRRWDRSNKSLGPISDFNTRCAASGAVRPTDPRAHARPPRPRRSRGPLPGSHPSPGSAGISRAARRLAR